MKNANLKSIFFSVLLTMMSLLLIVNTNTINIFASNYSNDYRYWGQGGSDDANMRQYGCWVVAQSKLIYETNIDRSNSFNPDSYLTWQKANGFINSNFLQINGANAPVAYANQKGKTLNYLGYWNASDEQLWINIDKGYYTILYVEPPEGGTHYVMVANELSLQKGVLYCYDSFYTSGTTSPQPLTRYSTRYGGYVYSAITQPSVIIPTSISLNNISATLLKKGATTTLIPTVLPSNATDKSVSWKSSNTSVATVSQSGVVTAVANGTATITATTKSGVKTATCSITVRIPSEPVLIDGWWYADEIPQEVLDNRDKYDIMYQNIYEVQAATSPGTGWSDTGIDVTTYEKSGEPWESISNVTTSDTVKLISSYYYHYCYEGTKTDVDSWIHGNYVHGDYIYDTNVVYEHASAPDLVDSNITYYHLKWTSNGADAYCNSSSPYMCKGEWGGHGNRSYYYYKMSTYQNYTKTTLNVYKKIGDWCYKIDDSAVTTKYRYHKIPLEVKLDKTDVTLKSIGATATLTATVLPEEVYNKNVKWFSSDETVATVSQDGVITAVGNGTATITVATEEAYRTAKCTVNVQVPVEKVTLDRTSVTFSKLGSTTLVATVSPNNSYNKSVIWESDNPDVAIVNQSGLVTAKGNGQATITVKTADGAKVAKCTVTVKIAVIGVTLDRTSVTFSKLGSTTLVETVSPSNAYNKAVTWKSSNPSVATVDQKGVVTSVGNGTTTITVTTVDGNKVAECIVTVKVAVTGVTLDRASVTFSKLGSTTLVSTVAPNIAYNKAVTWKSSNPSVAIVDTKGVVTSVGNGTTTITVTTVDGNKVAECTITVKIIPIHIEVNKTSATLSGKGNTMTLVATVSPNNAYNKSVTWTSSNTSIATVNSSGVVTAVGSGTATITATTVDGNKVATCTVKVITEALSVKLNTSTTSMFTGDTIKLTATAAGGAGGYTYSFFMYNEATKGWFRFNDFASATTYSWTSNASGNRTFYVEVKDSQGTVVRSEGIKVTNKSNLAVNLSVNDTEVLSGQNVKLTAKASGGVGSYTYSFLMYNESTKSWYRFNSFASANTYNWTANGPKTLYVEVKDGEGTVVRSTGVKVTIEALKVTLNANKTSMYSDETVKLTATASGGTGKYTYSFLMYNDATKSYYRFNSFASATSYSWTPYASGIRTLYVEVKDSEGTVVRSSGVKITISEALSVKLTANAGSVVKGSNLGFTATASGGSGKYTYSFLMYNENTKMWYRFASFADANKLSWIAGTTDTRVFYVEVKDSTGKVVRSEGITIKVLASTDLKATVTTSASSVAAGQSVKLTASATGGAGSYTYSFLIYNPITGNWGRLNDFKSANTYSWTASGSGERQFYVDVKDANGTVVRSAVKVVMVK